MSLSTLSLGSLLARQKTFGYFQWILSRHPSVFSVAPTTTPATAEHPLDYQHEGKERLKKAPGFVRHPAKVRAIGRPGFSLPTGFKFLPEIQA